MLNKNICYKCEYCGQAEELPNEYFCDAVTWRGSSIDNIINNVSEYREVCPGDLNKFNISKMKKPPKACPYTLEHLLSLQKVS